MAEDCGKGVLKLTTEELLQSLLHPVVGETDRTVAVYTVNVTDPVVSEALSSERFTNLQIAQGPIDPYALSLVDVVSDERSERNEVVHYRVLFLLTSLRGQLELSSRHETLANALSGSGLNLCGGQMLLEAFGDSTETLRKSLFNHPAEELHRMAGTKGIDKARKDTAYRMHRKITDFYEWYESRSDLVRLMSERNEDERWLVWSEPVAGTDMMLRLVFRHALDAEPESIVMVEYSVNSDVTEERLAELESQFNCDFDDSALDVEEEEPPPPRRTVTLRVVSGLQEAPDEVEFTFACPPEAETVADVLAGFALSFPMYEITTMCNELGEAVDCDEMVRATAVFVHTVSGSEVHKIPERPPVPVVFPRAQYQVANGLYALVCARLKSDGKRVENYSALSCVVLVPKFNSLKQQTEERIQGCAGLVEPNESFQVSVELYPNPAAQRRMQPLLQEIRGQRHPDKLYVFVVDECHYSPTVNSIPALHDADLRAMSNVVFVMVSATPYNCISTRSRIPLDNIVEWNSLVDLAATPNYIGFEHYFRSIAFTLPLPGDATMLDSQRLHWLEVITGDGSAATTAVVSLHLCDHRREYADHETLLAVVSQRLRAYQVPLTCAINGDGKVVFQRTRSLATPLSLQDTPLMQILGFPAGARFGKGLKAVTATADHQLGDAVALVSQNLRQDSTFVKLYGAIVAQCRHLQRINRKTAAKLSAQWRDEWRGLQGHGPAEPHLRKKMMSAKNGFTIILDYILSLAYYGSCRIYRHDQDATFHLRLLDAVTINDDVCADFQRMVVECCYFDDYRSGQACNIADALNTALEALYRAAHEEMNAPPGDLDRAACLRYILTEKLRAEATHDTTSYDQSWYTETDRIVRMLVTERSPAPMVLMRVYDKDENMAMQIVLRHALQVCGLVVTRPGKRSVPAFSVISDTSETRLLTQIEDHFRYDYNVGEDGAVLHVQDIVAQREQAACQAAAAAGTVRKANPDLKYEDLLNVPCLIILCEKGRMGDTFPHTLRALDLRLRTGGTASCFLQEIGRMCRYPRTQEAVLVNSPTEAETYCSSSDHGVTVSAADTQRFLGVARTADDIERIVRAAHPVTQWPVLLAKLVHPLPYALIDPAVMAAIRKAVNQREDLLARQSVAGTGGALITPSEMTERRRIHRIIALLQMPKGGLDEHLSSSNKMQPEPLRYTLKSTGSHYDAANDQEERHGRRFLLSAECQVGKTGAYLHFLSLLRNAIAALPGTGQPPPVLPRIPLGVPWHRWLIPRLDDLSQQLEMQYDFPKTGKYHQCIARQRLAQLQRLLVAMQDGGIDGLSFKQRFIDLIQEHEGTVTERGRRRLEGLPEYDTVPPIGSVDCTCILDYVNWDGRFERDGVWHPCRDELLAVFAQWQLEGGAVEVPLAQAIMFGEHPAVTSFEAEDPQDKSAPLTKAPGPTVQLVMPTLQAQDLNCRAKSVAEYQLVPRLLPVNESITVQLDDFFAETAAQCGNYHRPAEADGNPAVKLSIPRAALKASAGHLGQRSRATKLSDKLGSLLKSPGRIKHWVFTPTFSGTAAAGPQDKLLMRDDAYALPSGRLERWEDYGEVLLVRAGQLEDYRRFYGGTHIIAAMPDAMEYVEAHGLPGQVLSAEKHGCGYSRRFGQLLASYLGLSHVWMIDDYVLKCWQIVCEDSQSTRDKVKVQPATFSAVMTHIESLFHPGSESPYPHFAERKEEALEETNVGDLSEIIGPVDEYGVVGMWRGYQWREDVAHPVKRSYSVYSFFLLNVEATVRQGLFVPARSIWEDIEFNNLLDERGLMVCKLQVFAHEKKVHAPAQGWPERPAEEPTLFTVLRDKGHHVCRGALFYEDIMTVPDRHPVLVELEESLPPEPLQESVTFLTAAHHPSVFQDGALAGWGHAHTLETCVYMILRQSAVLGHAVERAAESSEPVHWLLLVPKAETITHADAKLITLKVPRADLSISFQLLPDVTEDSVLIILATLTPNSTAVMVVENNAVSVEPTQPPPSQLTSPSRVSPAPSASLASPRGQARRRRTGEQAMWFAQNAGRLMDQFRSRGYLSGQKRQNAIEDIFGRALPFVNDLGAQLADAAQLWKECRRIEKNTKDNLRRRSADRKGGLLPTPRKVGGTGVGASKGGEAGIEERDAARLSVGAALEGESGASEGPGSNAPIRGGEFSSEDDGEDGEDSDSDGESYSDDAASPAKRPRHDEE